MNWELSEFFEQGGNIVLDADQQRVIMMIRHKLVKMRIPFMYETEAEYKARGKPGPWEPLLRLWRPLTRAEINTLGC